MGNPPIGICPALPEGAVGYPASMYGFPAGFMPSAADQPVRHEGANRRSNRVGYNRSGLPRETADDCRTCQFTWACHFSGPNRGAVTPRIRLPKRSPPRPGLPGCRDHAGSQEPSPCLLRWRLSGHGRVLLPQVIIDVNE